MLGESKNSAKGESVIVEVGCSGCCSKAGIGVGDDCHHHFSGYLVDWPKSSKRRGGGLSFVSYKVTNGDIHCRSGEKGGIIRASLLVLLVHFVLIMISAMLVSGSFVKTTTITSFGIRRFSSPVRRGNLFTLTPLVLRQNYGAVSTCASVRAVGFACGKSSTSTTDQRCFMSFSSAASSLGIRHSKIMTRLYSTSSITAPSSNNETITSSLSSTKQSASSKPSSTSSPSSSNRPYKLVIVESPSKCNTISKILNSYVKSHNLSYDFIVDSSMGHVRDLPSSAALVPSSLKNHKTRTTTTTTSTTTTKQSIIQKTPVLGVDVYNNYTPIYIILPEKQHVVQNLQSLAWHELCEEIILATDEDREGEAIAWHLSEVLSLVQMEKGVGNQRPKGIPMRRVTFNEITPTSVSNAFFSSLNDDDDNDGEKNVHPTHTDPVDSTTTATTTITASQEETASTPDNANHKNNNNNHNNNNGIDMDLVSAQETRRILDRLAGYTMSPILWKKIAPGLSAGRVQSVGLSLVVNREMERMMFKESEYWDLNAKLLRGGLSIDRMTNEENGNGNEVYCKGETFEATMYALNGIRLASGKDFDGKTGKLLVEKDNVYHLTSDGAEEVLTNLAGGEMTSFLRDPNVSNWTIKSIESKTRSNSPPPPFITSTLQQEANKRLGLSVGDTMRFAQVLYEAGYISYMRTDSSHLSNDAIEVITGVIRDEFGSENVANSTDPNAKSQRKKKKNKNAQEAHEAIRPSIRDGTFVRPALLASYHKQAEGGGSGNLPDAAIKLYELIYNRSTASLMCNQISNQTTIDIEAVSPDGATKASFRASGSVVVSPGYTVVWGGRSSDSLLPPNLVEGQQLHCDRLTALEHHTQPPPRYTEASFVKELESLGVGRPSTYASVVQTLRQRAYIGTPLKADETARNNGAMRRGASGTTISARRAAGGEEFMGSGRGPLVPSLSAFVVCSLLEKHCPSYVDPNFTASMEDRLDKIALGDSSDEHSRVSYLDEYYAGENGLAAQVRRIDLEVSADEARRAKLPSLFVDGDGTEKEEIGLFIGPWGPYIQKVGADASSTDAKKPPSAPLPMGMAADLTTITPETLKALLSSRERDGVILGQHPDDGRNIRLKVGRFGAYLQWGDDNVNGTTTHTLPKHIGGMRNLDFHNSFDERGYDSDGNLGSMLGLTLEEAIGYVSLPRTVCTLNDLPITAGIGRFGPYLKYNNSFVSLNKKDGDVLTVDAETAERLVTEGIINKTSKLGRGVLAELGEKEGGVVRVKDGRFGVYINWKRVNAKIPPEFVENPTDLHLEEAWKAIQEKAGSSGKGQKKQKERVSKRSTSPSVTLPPPPKRPLSAYLHFCAEKRSEVAKSVTSLGEISKELARLWALTADEEGKGSGRQRYENLAAADKIEYEKRKAAWQEECDRILAEAGHSALDKNALSVERRKGSQSTSTRKKAAKTKTPSPHASMSMPKKPKSAYLYFCADKRPGVAQNAKSLGEISKELARLWAKTLENGGEARRKYEELAAIDKARYEEEMLQYGATEAASASKIPKVTKQTTASTKKSTRGKDIEKSVRAPSAYMLFCKENRNRIVDENGNKLSFGETTKRLAEMWKECDSETRSFFENKAAEEKQKLL